MNYVKEQNTRNGIIAFEEIDAMTSIVHRRDMQSASAGSVASGSLPDELGAAPAAHDGIAPAAHDGIAPRRNSSLAASITETLKSEDLTLSHILSMFDGVLCEEGRVF